MNEYQEFLAGKRVNVEATGFDVPVESISPKAFLFQRDVMLWALQLGRAALFEECGLGKTFQYLEWAKHVTARTNAPVLILAPLAVAYQVVGEGEKFGVSVKYCHEQSEVGDARIVVTNYERLAKFDASHFKGVVLDESSVLKNFTGKTKQLLVETFKGTPYKLACTATPAPNDHLEFGNHAEFLDVMPSHEMLARWFINDTMQAGNYRLKKHAAKDFWRWLTSWAVCLSRPGDLGEAYELANFDLPPLHIHEHLVKLSEATIARTFEEGRLIPDDKPSSTALHKVKRESLTDRVDEARKIASAIDTDRPIVFWCDTNDEADALKAAFPEAVEVRGSDSAERKESKLRSFSEGKARMIITKPDIAGFGLNWQHCADQIFIGVSYSFERTYQALRRSYRFGQTKPVNAHLIYGLAEGNVLTTLREKQAAFAEMQAEMNAAMREHGLFRGNVRRELASAEGDTPMSLPFGLTATAESKVFDQSITSDYALYLGDCVRVMSGLPDASVDFSVYSPPFASLYTYSDSDADMGNSGSMEEFLKHYEYAVKDLYRMTKPGRLTAVHVKDLPLYKSSSEWFGVEDFSGLVTYLHRRNGWVFHSRITIWKDPVIEMERTNSHGLLHKNFVQRAQVCRVGLPDYLMVFVKPDPDGMGEGVKQLRKVGDYIGDEPPAPHEYLHSLRQRKPEWYEGALEDYNYSIAVWQRYASPVWFDINQTRVLNAKIARADKDEKHLAPLQLDVAERAIDIWTNKGEVVFTPFAGIGTEIVSAINLGRRGIGAELKPEYFEIARDNCDEAERKSKQVDLFTWAERQVNPIGLDMPEARHESIVEVQEA